MSVVTKNNVEKKMREIKQYALENKLNFFCVMKPSNTNDELIAMVFGDESTVCSMIHNVLDHSLHLKDEKNEPEHG